MKKMFMLFVLFSISNIAQANLASTLLQRPSKDPVAEFSSWAAVAKDNHAELVNMASFATVDEEGYPQQRFMHIKEYTSKGFIFPSHSFTPKALQLQKNSKTSVIFLWKIGKSYLQIRAVGEVKQIELADAKTKQDDLHKQFYNYSLTPKQVQFAFIDKSNDMVVANYVHYSSQQDGAWAVKQSQYKFPKIK